MKKKRITFNEGKNRTHGPSYRHERTAFILRLNSGKTQVKSTLAKQKASFVRVKAR
jgi:hypothetical protein